MKGGGGLRVGRSKQAGCRWRRGGWAFGEAGRGGGEGVKGGGGLRVGRSKQAGCRWRRGG